MYVHGFKLILICTSKCTNITTKYTKQILRKSNDTTATPIQLQCHKYAWQSWHWIAHSVYVIPFHTNTWPIPSTWMSSNSHTHTFYFLKCTYIALMRYPYTNIHMSTYKCIFVCMYIFKYVEEVWMSVLHAFYSLVSNICPLIQVQVYKYVYVRIYILLASPILVHSYTYIWCNVPKG